MRLDNIREKCIKLSFSVLGLAFGNFIARQSFQLIWLAIFGRFSVFTKLFMFPFKESVGGLGSLAAYWGTQKMIEDYEEVVRMKSNEISMNFHNTFDNWTQLTWGFLNAKSSLVFEESPQEEQVLLNLPHKIKANP